MSGTPKTYTEAMDAALERGFQLMDANHNLFIARDQLGRMMEPLAKIEAVLARADEFPNMKSVLVSKDVLRALIDAARGKQ